MNENKLFSAIGGIDEELIDEALKVSAKRKISAVKFLTAAAVLVFIALSSAILINLGRQSQITVSPTDSSSESKSQDEYQKAVEYCKEKNIFIEGLSEDDVNRVYKNVSSSAFVKRSDEASDECRQFIYNFITNYDKKVSSEGKEILKSIFDLYSGVNLTQEQCEKIYESMVQQREANDFVDKFSSYYMDKHGISREDYFESENENSGDAQEILKKKAEAMEQFAEQVNYNIMRSLFYKYYGLEMTMEQYEQEYEKSLEICKERKSFTDDMMSNYKGDKHFMSAVDPDQVWASIFDKYGYLNLTREQYEQIYENFENPFKQAVIAGLVDENTPYITMEQVNKIVAESENAQEIYEKMCAIRPPDNNFIGSGVYGGATFKINEHENIYCEYGYGGVVAVHYRKHANGGDILKEKYLFPTGSELEKFLPYAVEENDDNITEPKITIGNPEKIGNAYIVTVTSDIKEPFKLVLEEDVTGTSEIYKQTVLMIDGKGTFETEHIASYQPVGYFIGGTTVSEKNIKTSVSKGYSDILKDGQLYTKITLSMTFTMEIPDFSESSGYIIYDIESDSGEYVSNVMDHMILGQNSKRISRSFEVKDKIENFNVKIIPKYFLSDKLRYFKSY